MDYSIAVLTIRNNRLEEDGCQTWKVVEELEIQFGGRERTERMGDWRINRRGQETITNRST